MRHELAVPIWDWQSEATLLLQSHKDFDVVGDFDPTTGAFMPLSRKGEPQRACQEVCGSFDYIGGKRVLLFRLAGVLYLQVNDQRLPFDNLLIELSAVGVRRLLRVVSSGRTAFELLYSQPSVNPPLSDDPTPFVEKEDFDFGLFLANLSRDRSRQERLYLGC